MTNKKSQPTDQDFNISFAYEAFAFNLSALCLGLSALS